MKRTITIAGVLVGTALIGYVGFGINHLVSRSVQMKHNDVQLELKSAEAKQLELDIKQLNGKLESELQQNQTDAKTQEELNQKVQELEQRNKELEVSKAARDAEKQRIAAAAEKAITKVTGTATAYAADGNAAKAFIYAKESGNNPGAINSSSGACGLGQALPCSKMPCSLSDYACQDRFFTDYAMRRYGSWEAAQSFWQANRWW